MRMAVPLFAQVDYDPLAGFWKSLGDTARSSATLFAALTLLVLSIVVWAVFLRKRRRHSEHHQHHPHHHPEQHAAAPASAAQDPPSHRRRHRRRRREHRPRNPTLAETGGLPPIRTDPPSPEP